MNPQDNGHPCVKACDALGICPQSNRSRKNVGPRQTTADEGCEDCSDNDSCNQPDGRPLHSVSPVRRLPSAVVKPLFMSQSGPGEEEEGNCQAPSQRSP